MEPTAAAGIRRAFAAFAARVEGESPLTAALLRGLERGPSPSLLRLYDRYYRIMSVTQPDPAALVAALHAAALAGEADALAELLPSCGGRFESGLDEARLQAAAEATLEQAGATVLDNLLTGAPPHPQVEYNSLLLLGSTVAARHFGGGLSLLQLGAGTGLHLLWDRYSYRFGETRLGAPSGPLLEAEIAGADEGLITGALPVIVGRRGLEPDPADLTDPVQRLAAEATFYPDQFVRLERFRAACALLGGADRPVVSPGLPGTDVAPLLAESYAAMAPHHTLLLFDCGIWPRLTDAERRQVALAVQRLAARLEPHKPLAWLQAEPFAAAGGRIELRLQTFGWDDPEDRQVLRLAETDPQLRQIRWL